MGLEKKDNRQSAISAEEAELIERAKVDADAFGELYEQYVDRIYSYIYYRLHNVEDAEDLTTRVFQRAMSNMPKYQNTGAPFSAWLYRIARNLVLNWHRDTAKKQTIDLDEIAYAQIGDESPEIEIQWMEKESTLMQAIRELPTERQDVLLYKFLYRMSNAEIGEMMGKTEGAVKSLYHRTLISLRGMLTVEAMEGIVTPIEPSAEDEPSTPTIRDRFRKLRKNKRTDSDS